MSYQINQTAINQSNKTAIKQQPNSNQTATKHQPNINQTSIKIQINMNTRRTKKQQHSPSTSTSTTSSSATTSKATTSTSTSTTKATTSTSTSTTKATTTKATTLTSKTSSIATTPITVHDHSAIKPRVLLSQRSQAQGPIQASIQIPWGVAIAPYFIAPLQSQLQDYHEDHKDHHEDHKDERRQSYQLPQQLVVSDVRGQCLKYFQLQYHKVLNSNDNNQQHNNHNTGEAENTLEIELQYQKSIGQPQPSSSPTTTNLGLFKQPVGLTYQPHTHNLLVCDDLHQHVQVLTVEGTPLYQIGRYSRPSLAPGRLSAPRGVCCTANANICVADSTFGRIHIFDAAGRVLKAFGFQPMYAQSEQDLSSLPLYADGHEYLNAPHDVCGLDRHFSPSSVASSLLLVADTYNSRICAWSADGQQHIGNFQAQKGPLGICVDLNGMVNVSCAGEGAHVVEIYDPRHSLTMKTPILKKRGRKPKWPSSTSERRLELVQTLGLASEEGGAGKGQFSLPTGITVDNYNTLIVADRNNHRVQCFV